MNKAKTFYTITLVLTLIVMSIGATYAYFAATIKSEDNEPIAKSANYSINLSVLPKYPVPENGPYTLIPMKNELSDKALTGYNGQPCVDKNSAVVCQIYEIYAFEYNKDLDYLSGSLNITTSNISSLSYRVYDEENNPLAIEQDEEGSDVYIKSITSGEELSLGDAFYVKGKESLTLNLMIWLSDTGVSQNETDIGTYTGNVTFYTGKAGQISGYISSVIEGRYEG